MKQEIKHSPILVTGCPRSGAGLIAQAIRYCNVFSGVTSKRYMYENIDIRWNILTPYFETLNADIDGQYPLPINPNIIPDWKDKINAEMVNQGLKEGQWMVKDAKSALIWKTWNHAYPNAKWIIVRRRTGDIIQSCLRTGYMKAFSNPEILKQIGASTEKEGWLWWVHQYEARFVEMIQEGLNVKIVFPERLVDGDYRQLYETLEWAGVKPKDNLVSVLEPMLWKGRNKKKGDYNG